MLDGGKAVEVLYLAHVQACLGRLACLCIGLVWVCRDCGLVGWSCVGSGWVGGGLGCDG